MTGAWLLALGAGTGGVAWYLRERGFRRTRAVPAGLQRDVTLAHTEELELYHNAFSLCSKKVRMCLAELGIAYRAHHVDLIETGRYETLSREFLAVNPGAFVPVLVHRGHPVYESHEIIAYRMGRHLDDLETELGRSGGPWILGAQLTLADVSWAVILGRLREADWEDVLLGGRRLCVERFWEAIRARASYGAAMEAFRHPAVCRGTARIVAERRGHPAFDRALYGAGGA